MATEAATEDEEELKKKVQEVQYELRQPITDPINESTAEYYMNNKNKVGPLISLSLSNLKVHLISYILPVVWHKRYMAQHLYFKNIKKRFINSYCHSLVYDYMHFGIVVDR